MNLRPLAYIYTWNIYSMRISSGFWFFRAIHQTWSQLLEVLASQPGKLRAGCWDKLKGRKQCSYPQKTKTQLGSICDIRWSTRCLTKHKGVFDFVCYLHLDLPSLCFVCCCNHLRIRQKLHGHLMVVVGWYAIHRLIIICLIRRVD